MKQRKNQANTKPHLRKTPRSLIVTLLIVFPPLAWLLMARDKTYHHWLIKVLYVTGLFTLAFLSLFYFAVGVQVAELYATLDLQGALNEELMYGSMLCGAVFAVLQLIFAYICHRYLFKHRFLNHAQLGIIVSLLTFAYIVAIVPPLITIQAIYSLMVTL